MLIVDNGNGFMTLYGHTKNFYKKSGELVAAGDTIAAVGNSSGQDRTGLYFEIRHNGHPNNPERWCVTDHSVAGNVHLHADLQRKVGQKVLT